MDSNLGYVVAGYAVTVLGLGAYVASLLTRTRRARLRAAAIASRGRGPAGEP